MRNLLLGETVYVEREPNSNEKGGYDNSFVYLYRYSDGLFINEEIIRQGYGKCYSRLPFKYSAEFQTLENSAKKIQKGLWKLEDNSSNPVRTTNTPQSNPNPKNQHPTSLDTNSSGTATKQNESTGNNTSDKVYVHGYYRKNGTYVNGYYRSKPRK